MHTSNELVQLWDGRFEMADLRWQIWDGRCGMAGLGWQIWDGRTAIMMQLFDSAVVT